MLPGLPRKGKGLPQMLPGLAQTIARQIEADFSYPGEIKVTVVRELHASATAG